jgi:hypothetical protein
VSEIISLISSPGWWFTSVAVALVTGIVANYLFGRLGRGHADGKENSDVKGFRLYPMVAGISSVHILLTGLFWVYLMFPTSGESASIQEFLDINIAGIQGVVMGGAAAWVARAGKAAAVAQLVTFGILFSVAILNPFTDARGEFFEFSSRYVLASAIAAILNLALVGIFLHITEDKKKEI